MRCGRLGCVRHLLLRRQREGRRWLYEATRGPHGGSEVTVPACPSTERKCNTTMHHNEAWSCIINQTHHTKTFPWAVRPLRASLTATVAFRASSSRIVDPVAQRREARRLDLEVVARHEANLALREQAKRCDARARMLGGRRRRRASISLR